MKRTLIAPLDLYTLYERTLEGVIVNITIEYDLEDMIKNNVINNTNIKIINKEFRQDGLEFLEANPFSMDKIIKDIDAHYDDFDTLQEEWGEYMPEEEYERIAHIVEGMTASEP